MAKRVNTRFLILLTAVVMAGGVLLMAARFVLPRLLRQDPQKLVEESEQLEQAGDVDGAIKRYTAAVQARPRDPALRVGLGDLYFRHVAFDGQNLYKARQAWESTFTVDAAHRPAMQRLLDAAWELLALSSRAESFNQVRAAAKRILDLDPADAQALARLNMATIRQAQADVPTPRADIEAAVTALRALSGRMPEDAEVARWAGRGELHLASLSLKGAGGGGTPEARDALARLETWISAMLKGQDANSAMQFTAAQLYNSMSALDRSSNPPADQAGPLDAEASRPARYAAQLDAALAAARAHVKPTDREYVEVQLACAEWLLARDKRDEAHKLLDDMVASAGDEPKVRLAYARMFARDVARDPARRDKVLELLARPTDVAGLHGVEVIVRQDLEAAMLLELSGVRLSGLEAAPAGDRQPAELAVIESDLKRLERSISPQSVPLLEIKGRIALMRGQLPDAIGLLQQAVDRRGGGSAPNYDVMYQLANAYLSAGQTGQAEKLLGRIVAQFPGSVPARALLIQTLARDGQAAAARRELATLRKLRPDAPDIAGLAAIVEGGTSREAFVGQMADKTPAEKVNKAIVLRAAGKAEEAIELARAAFEQEPTFLPAVRQLLELYHAAGRRADAVDLAKAAIAANPNEAQLKGLPDMLAERSPEALDKWRLEQINAEADAFARELKLFDFHAQKAVAPATGAALRESAAAAAERHLNAADKLKPGDLKNVAVRRFELSLVLRRFGDADKVLAALAAADTDGVKGELLRFRLAMARPDLAVAEAAAREMTRQRPQFAQGYQHLGQVMQAKGRHREAVSAYTEALDRQGRNYAALRGLIEAHGALNEPAEAGAALARARTLFPNDATLRELALSEELRSGDLAKVIAARERALREKPEVPQNALSLAEAYLHVLSRPSAAGAAQAALAKGRKVLEDGMAKWPDDDRFRWPLAQVLLAQGDFAAGERILKERAARADGGESAPDAAGAVAGLDASHKVTAELQLADYYRRAGKADLAEQSLREAAAKSGQSPAVRQRLATVLAEMGRYDEAVKELDGISGPAAARQRVQHLVQANNGQAAERAARAALAADPASADMSDLLVETLLFRRAVDEAGQLVAERLAKNEADASARFLSARVKLTRQPPQVQAATKELTELVGRNPNAVNARGLLAEARYAAGETSEAIDELGRVLAIAPINREVRVKLIDWCAKAGRWEAVLQLATDAVNHPRLANDPAWHRALANAYVARGDVKQAEASFARAKALVPAARAELDNEHLGVLIAFKKYAQVLELTDAWLADGRKDWWLHRARGLARHGAGDADAGLKDFDAALAGLDPVEQFAAAHSVVKAIAMARDADAALQRLQQWVERDPRWRLLAAELHLGKQDPAGALFQVEPLLAEASKLTEESKAAAYDVAAKAYHQLQPTPELDKALAMYQRYLQLRPRDAVALNNVAYLLAEQVSPANPSEAISYSQKAYDIVKDWGAGEAKSRILDTHGWVLVLNGGRDFEKGVMLLEQVVEESPIAEAHYHLGEAHLRKKRGIDAEEQFRLALEAIENARQGNMPVDPTLDPRVRKALERARALNAAAGAG